MTELVVELRTTRITKDVPLNKPLKLLSIKTHYSLARRNEFTKTTLKDFDKR